MSGRNMSLAPRGFAWPLSPLRSRLDLALDHARSGCGVLQRQAVAAGQKLQAMREHEAEEAALLDAGARSRLDPHGRAQGLHYLASIAARVASQAQERQAAQDLVDKARAACVALEMQIACLDEVRKRLLQAHRREQVARDTREADASWLGERQRRLAAQAPSVGAMP